MPKFTQNPPNECLDTKALKGLFKKSIGFLNNLLILGDRKKALELTN